MSDPCIHTDAEQIAGVRRLSSTGPTAFRPINKAEVDVLVERSKQRLKHGDVRDDGYTDAELVSAANAHVRYVLLLAPAGGRPHKSFGEALEAGLNAWPFARESFNPGDLRTALVRAAALIIAEIDRLDRAAAKGGAE